MCTAHIENFLKFQKMFLKLQKKVSAILLHPSFLQFQKYFLARLQNLFLARLQKKFLQAGQKKFLQICQKIFLKSQKARMEQNGRNSFCNFRILFWNCRKFFLQFQKTFLKLQKIFCVWYLTVKLCCGHLKYIKILFSRVLCLSPYNTDNTLLQKNFLQVQKYFLCCQTLFLIV